MHEILFRARVISHVNVVQRIVHELFHDFGIVLHHSQGPRSLVFGNHLRNFERWLRSNLVRIVDSTFLRKQRAKGRSLVRLVAMNEDPIAFRGFGSNMRNRSCRILTLAF